ncbi:MAG TPA: antitoxin family protein [Phycisphaerales bacterium]|jgi:hypothetical protein|nr:antitoxin family protein [Phycisphaerales bacterium]
MIRSFKAIFENGVIRPLQPLLGLPNRASLDVTVTSLDHVPSTTDANGVRACLGTISDADAAEMAKLVTDEFERVDERDW